MSSTSSKFDDLLSILGTDKWNLFTLAVMAYWCMLMPIQTLGGVFFVPEVPHTCVLPPGATPLTLSGATPAPTTTTTRSLAPQNTTTATTTTTTITATIATTRSPDIINMTETEIVSQCKYLMVVNGTEEVLQCTEWDFDDSTYGYTLTEESELVCGRKFMRPVYQSMYFFGAFFGSPASGWLADRYGRKTVVSVACVTYMVLVNSLFWITNLTAIMVIRFITGFIHPACLQTAYTMLMEMFQQSHRSMAGIIVFLPWPFGMMILGGVAYLFRNWRWTYLTTSLPLLLFLPVLWFIDESPRWLIVRGHHDRALRVLQKAARWNKASLPPEYQLRKLMADITEESTAVTTSRERGLTAQVQRVFNQFYILLRTRMLRRITLCVYSCFLVSGLSYYGLSMSGEAFSFSPYVYIVLSGIMEIPGATVTIPILNTIGRRISSVFCFCATSVVILSLSFIPKNIAWLTVTLGMIGKLTISAAFQIIFLHAAELFPTEVRTRGSGTASMMSKTGSFIAPFIAQSLREVWSAAPSVVLGCAAMVGSFAAFLMPETKGAPLYDTVAALETEAHTNRSRRQSKDECDPEVRSAFNT